MTDAVLFWLLAEVIGLLAIPAGRALFGRLPGGGLAFSRPLGLLLAVYPAWLLASVHLVGYGRATVFVGLGLLAAVFLGWSLPRLQPLLQTGALRAALRTTPVRLWLAGELIFTIGFFGWALVRSYSPDVWQTEKPMDMAFVNSVNRAEWFPPHDPWLSGASLNYYYYGHYLVAYAVRATGIDPVSGFNLGLALFFALTLATVFALASALYLAASRVGAPRRSPVVVGVAGVVVTVLLGNIAGGVQYLQHPGQTGLYDWWSPSRVIPGTANEFPVFSFLLGDLHAHVLAVPFTLLSIALALQLALRGPQLKLNLRAGVELLLAALAVGVLYPLNSLDFPVAGVLILGGLALWATRRGITGRVRIRAAVWFAIWAAAGVLLYLPFWIHFSPAVHGLGIVGEHQPFRLFARDELLVYGLFLWVIAAAYLHRAARVPFKYLAWGSVAATVLLVLLASRHYAGLALLLALAAFAAYMAFDPGRSQPVPVRLAARGGGAGSDCDRRGRLPPRLLRRHVLVPLQHRIQVRLRRLVPARPGRDLHRLLEPGLDGSANPVPLAQRARRLGRLVRRLSRAGRVLPVPRLRVVAQPRRRTVARAEGSRRSCRDRLAALVERKPDRARDSGLGLRLRGSGAHLGLHRPAHSDPVAGARSPMGT